MHNSVIYSSNEEALLYISKIVIEANEHILNDDIASAEESYSELMRIYSLLDYSLKSKVYKLALKIRSKILFKKNPFSQSIKFNSLKLSNGMLVYDLYHLVYVLENIKDEDLTIEAKDKLINELIYWIKKQLLETELAILLEGISNISALKSIILRYLILKNLLNND
jgi:hypothetical protein